MRKYHIGFITKLYHYALQLLRQWLGYYSFNFYKLNLQHLPDEQTYNIREFRSYSDDIASIHREMGREKEYSPSRARQRFTNGLYFYALIDQQTVVASSWIHPQGKRFIDETGYMVSTVENSLWLRDIYVNPDYRGKQICANFIRCAARQFYPAATTFYSDIESQNTASIRAHQRAGFQYMCTLKAVHLFKYLMLRSRPSPACADLQITGYRADRKCFLTRKDYQLYRQYNLA
ncbi:MAG TPA: GNAT family N-acetyltransferase [Gammaproteobacteria bacterium]